MNANLPQGDDEPGGHGTGNGGASDYLAKMLDGTDTPEYAKRMRQLATDQQPWLASTEEGLPYAPEPPAGNASTGVASRITGHAERDGEPTPNAGKPGIGSHEPECRTARYVTILGYEPEDAEHYCICPELHGYRDRLTAEAMAELWATVDGMRTDIARARQVPERRRRAPVGIVDTPAGAHAHATTRQALAAADSGTVDAGITARAKLRILAHPMVTAEEVTAAGGTADQDMLIMLPIGGRGLYPAFQYTPDLACVDVHVPPVNWALDVASDPWGAASWWLFPHARLGGRPPYQLLGTADAAQLLVLARAEGREPNNSGRQALEGSHAGRDRA